MAVAECSGVSATDLSPPLSAVVDPDALDTLLADHPARGSLLQITFDYAGCHVAVGSDGTLDVRRNAAAPS